MKERNFKFRKSFAEVIRVMDDKQAGKFIKAVCDYVFDGRGYDGNDTAIKTAFTPHSFKYRCISPVEINSPCAKMTFSSNNVNKSFVNVRI